MKYWIPILVLLLSCGRERAENAAPEQLRNNVVLISIDTLRADAVGAYGSTKAVTPRMDSLADSGVLFQRALSHTPLTLPSHASLLTGNLPITHGIHDNNGFRLRSGQKTLASLFHENGYRTAAFVSSIVLDHRSGLNQGFETYMDQFPLVSQSMESKKERIAEETTARAAGWIRDNKDHPFLLFVHYYDPHAPYHPPAKIAGTIGLPYLEEVRYVDEQIGILLQAIDPVRARTVVAITSDHGEGLGDHEELGHGLFLYDSTLRVPLILSGLGIPSGIKVPAQVGISDVMPTLMELAGLKAVHTDGHSLMPLLQGKGFAERPVFSETLYPLQIGWSPLFAITTAGRKYIEAPKPEFFDLHRDPDETRNLLDANRLDAQQASEKIARYKSAALADKKQRAGDSTLEEQLRSLGYLSGSSSSGNLDALADPKEKLEVWKLFERSTFLSMDGQNTEAAALMERAVKMDPRNPILLDTLGRYLFFANPERAAQQWIRALQLDPRNHTFHHKLAECYVRLNDKEKALQQEQLAIRLEPEMQEALVGAGALLIQMGKPAEALPYLESALKIDPHDAIAAYQSGLAWQNFGDIQRAAVFFEQSISWNPEFPLAFYDLGIVRAQMGDFASAEKHLRRAAELAPAFAEPLYNLGVLYERTGRTSEAASAYNEFLRLAAAPHLAPRIAAAQQRLRTLREYVAAQRQ